MSGSERQMGGRGRGGGGEMKDTYSCCCTRQTAVLRSHGPRLVKGREEEGTGSIAQLPPEGCLGSAQPRLCSLYAFRTSVEGG